MAQESGEEGVRAGEGAYRLAAGICRQMGWLERGLAVMRSARAAGFPPSNRNFREMLMSCAEAAMRESGSFSSSQVSRIFFYTSNWIHYILYTFLRVRLLLSLRGLVQLFFISNWTRYISCVSLNPAPSLPPRSCPAACDISNPCYNI